MPRPIAEQAIVITGASSGIGRATAVEFGRHGARLVLAARGDEALDAACREVEEAGGRAYPVPTDVRTWSQVEQLADDAMGKFDRIDTWVNAAAVALYAKFEDVTPEEFEQVVRTNLFGVAWGTKAALAKMRTEGEGTIINISSVLGQRAVPLQSAYVAAKHGVRGMDEAIRLELDGEESEIKLVTIFPSSINTPFFDHARSKMGVKPAPIPPVYEPQVVAEAIVHAAEHPQAEIVVGGAGKLLSLGERMNPAFLDKYMTANRRMEQQQKTDEPAYDDDNLFAPLPGPGSVEGSFGEGAKTESVYTKLLEEHPGRKAAAVAAGAIGALFLARRMTR